jgi:outer membrane protein OmpA-like peptidoglycan-associated protein
MKFSFLVLMVVAAGNVAFAADNTYDVGSQAATWLNLPDSPRTAAMGSASVALGGDVNTLSVNPAGLSDLGGQQLSLMEDADVQNTDFEHIAYGLGLGANEGAAVSVDYMDYGSVAEYEQANGLLVPNGTVDPYGLSVDLGYGCSFGPLSVGATMALVSENLGIGENSTVGGDLGLQWRQQDPSGWAAGLAVRNFGGQLEGSNLPTIYQAGLAYYQSLLGGDRGLNLNADAAVPTAEVNAESLSLGAEYTGNSLWAVRAGYRFIGNNGVGGLTVGGGLKYRSISVDYAFVSGGVLGNANLISLSILFPAISQTLCAPSVEATPVSTPVATPISTPIPTPVLAPIATPIPAPVLTPISTPVPTPLLTPLSTPMPTPAPTPIPVSATAALLSPEATPLAEAVTAAVQASPVPTLQPIILRDAKDAVSGYYVKVRASFVKGSSSLSAKGEAELAQGYAWMLRYPSSRVSVYGYTDPSGGALINEPLSVRRAREVVRYLESLGLPARRIVKVKGWGSDRPIAENSTEEGRLINRRAELRITGKSLD